MRVGDEGGGMTYKLNEAGAAFYQAAQRSSTPLSTYAVWETFPGFREGGVPGANELNAQATLFAGIAKAALEAQMGTGTPSQNEQMAAAAGSVPAPLDPNQARLDEQVRAVALRQAEGGGISGVMWSVGRTISRAGASGGQMGVSEAIQLTAMDALGLGGQQMASQLSPTLEDVVGNAARSSAVAPPGVAVPNQAETYTADAAKLTKAQWLKKWAPVLGIGAAVGIAALLVFAKTRGGRRRKGRRGKKRSSSRRTKSKVRHRKKRGGKRGSRRADIYYPADGSTGPGSGVRAAKRKGGGRHKNVDSSRGHALMKAIRANGRMSAASKQKALAGVRKRFGIRG